jgi:hypothetical protein
MFLPFCEKGRMNGVTKGPAPSETNGTIQAHNHSNYDKPFFFQSSDARMRFEH